MSTVSRGFTFVDGPSPALNYTALNALMDNASATNIGLTEFDSSCHLHQTKATAPSSDQGDGSTWFDSTLGIYRQKGGSTVWNMIDRPHVTNTSGATIPRGAWVRISGDNSIAACATHRWPEHLGVLTATCINTATDLVATGIIAPALVLGPCTAGDYLVIAGSTFTSHGLGYAVSCTLGSSGSRTATLGIECGIALGSISAATTGLVTCMIFG